MVAATSEQGRPSSGSSGRWRTFADAIAAALGLNLWVSLVLLPAVVAGTLHGGWAELAAALPLAVLALGIWRRSELVLLLGYPGALLVPLAGAPEAVAVHIYGPVRFTLVALGLVGYLLGASLFTSFRDVPPPLNQRALASASRPVPSRWRRRFRIYTALTVLSVVFPVVLLYTINFDRTAREFMARQYAGKVAPMTAVMNLGAIGFWVLLYGWFFLGVLRQHRTGDSQLVAELAQLRRETRRARPRPQFYLGVAAALALMIALLLRRG